MPCQTVQVSGPEITGELRVSSLDVVASGVNEIDVTFVVENTANVRLNGTVVVTLDGQQVHTIPVGLSQGNSRELGAVLDTSLGEGESRQFTVCAEVQ